MRAAFAPRSLRLTLIQRFGSALNLKHLKQEEALQAGIQPHELPPERAPPVLGFFD